MLIIQIALGIVLGWLIINHFEKVIEFTVETIGLIFRAIFFPFKLIFRFILSVVEIISYYRKGFALFLLSLIAIGIVITVFVGIHQFIPEEHKTTGTLIIFGIGLSIAAFIFFKDMFEVIRDKLKK